MIELVLLRQRGIRFLVACAWFGVFAIPVVGLLVGSDDVIATLTIALMAMVLPTLHAWRGRLLDAFGGLARNTPAQDHG